MATDKTISFPVRLPTELDADLQRASELTGVSKQDLMRLCLRIGLVDLAAAENDLPGSIKRAADDKGLSFQQWSQSKENAHFQTPTPVDNLDACADSAPSRAPSPSPTSRSKKTANIVRLPAPPLMQTIMHDSLKVAKTPAQYHTRRKNSAED